MGMVRSTRATTSTPIGRNAHRGVRGRFASGLRLERFSVGRGRAKVCWAAHRYRTPLSEGLTDEGEEENCMISLTPLPSPSPLPSLI